MLDRFCMYCHLKTIIKLQYMSWVHLFLTIILFAVDDVEKEIPLPVAVVQGRRVIQIPLLKTARTSLMIKLSIHGKELQKKVKMNVQLKILSSRQVFRPNLTARLYWTVIIQVTHLQPHLQVPIYQMLWVQQKKDLKGREIPRNGWEMSPNSWKTVDNHIRTTSANKFRVPRKIKPSCSENSKLGYVPPILLM